MRPLELPYTFPLTTLGVYKNQKPQCSSKLNSPLEGHKLGEKRGREGRGGAHSPCEINAIIKHFYGLNTFISL